MNIILGSSSPRRKNILKNIITEFKIIIPDNDESILKNELAIDYVLRISKEKNESVISKIENKNYPLLIITSDTIVTLKNKILGKPEDHIDAINTLKILSGKKHQVITGISLSYIKNESDPLISITDITSTDVIFKNLTEDIILDYLNKINYTDKAGSYAIQEFGDMIISEISGSMTNIIGFPVRLFFALTNGLGILDKIISIK